MSDLEHDDKIHQALKGRQVPDHRDGFFDDLRSQLSTDSAPRIAPHVALRRRHYRRYLWTSSVVAAGIAAIVLANSINNGSGPTPSPATIVGPDATSPTTQLQLTLASQVITQTSEKLSSVASLGGTVTFEEFPFRFEMFTSPASKSVTEFRISSKGDFWSRETTSGRSEEMSFLTKSGEQRMILADHAYITTNAGTPPQTMGVYRLSVLISSLRAMAHTKDIALEETTFDGRPAWQLEANTTIDTSSLGPDHYVITVDKDTLFPVEAIGSREGRPLTRATLSDLRINDPYQPSDFVSEIPKGMATSRLDGGYRVVELGEVESIVGYQPFVPSFLPDGFTLNSVSANRDAGPGGPEGSNSFNRNLVTLTYRRGLEVFQVTTRASANGGETWNDPHSYEGEPPHTTERVKLQSGSFADLTADVIATSTSKPHLWVIGARWLMTIAGDLSRSELVQIAESLESPSASNPSVNPSTTTTTPAPSRG